MTPYELQIGDFVKVADMTVKVTALSENTINGQPATMFHPIPLTTEILEANGFEVEEECDYSEWGLGNLYILTKDEGLIEVYWRDSCDDEDLIWFAYICGFNACADMTRVNKHIYVHELQQALRLCGLNEIAATLKTKKP